MKTQTFNYRIVLANGKKAMPDFTQWKDCVRILNKLHRLGIEASIKKVLK